MCRELSRAGQTYEAAGQTELAFDRYYRAARSRAVAGGEASVYLIEARRIAGSMQDEQLMAQVERLAPDTSDE